MTAGRVRVAGELVLDLNAPAATGTRASFVNEPDGSDISGLHLMRLFPL
jgi:hypothetical protein